MQSDSPGTARQPCNHHFAPVDPQGSLLVGELAAELQCESAGIGGVCDGIVATAHRDVETKCCRWRLDHLVEKIAPGQQVHDFTGYRGPVVDHPQIRDCRKIGGREPFQERQHCAKAGGIGRIDFQHRIRAVRERLGRGERRLSGRQVVTVFRPRVSREAPAVRDDPWTPCGRGHTGARGRAGSRKRLAGRQLRAGERARREPDLRPALDTLRPQETRQRRQEQDSAELTHWRLQIAKCRFTD